MCLRGRLRGRFGESGGGRGGEGEGGRSLNSFLFGLFISWSERATRDCPFCFIMGMANGNISTGTR